MINGEFTKVDVGRRHAKRDEASADMIILTHGILFVELEAGDKFMGTCVHGLTMEFCLNNARVVTLADDQLLNFTQNVMRLTNS